MAAETSIRTGRAAFDGLFPLVRSFLEKDVLELKVDVVVPAALTAATRVLKEPAETAVSTISLSIGSGVAVGSGIAVGAGAGVGVAAGAQAAITREATTSNIANIVKRFIFFSISKVVQYLHMFCTSIVQVYDQTYIV